MVRRMLAIGEEPQWGTMPNRSWDTSCWVANSARLQSVLGWKPVVSFEEGFRLTVDWLRGNPGILEHYQRGIASGEKTR